MILSFAFAPRVGHRFEAALPLRQPDRLKTNALSNQRFAPRLPVHR